MIRKLLVANRGEIAVRVIRACSELGIAPVAVYSDADASALHVQVAGEAIRIGPRSAAESYLNQDAIIAAAKGSGADAIHPGYGFLAENAEFADRCRAEGLCFVAPPAEAIRLMGDKAAAKRLARAAGVPVVPGYDGERQSDTHLAAEARRIGYPVLIKAAAGGGGKGIHAALRASEFRRALAQTRREASAAFGDGRVLLERLLVTPRHIEVQVIGDQFGAMVALGERECSIQRHHQKLIEEAPSPSVDDVLRESLFEQALRVARAAGYSNAGTVEFLLDKDGNAYFLEMNTRLQVEHAVTEAVYGIDLVRLQIELAAGERVRLSQTDTIPRGHAIECRVYAEDPSGGFLPSTGTVLVFRPPLGPGVRSDIGTFSGDVIGPDYDSLLTKITTHASNRATAIERMGSALEDCTVLGLRTNLPLLRRVIAHPSFRNADIDTEFLERDASLLAGDSAPPSVAPLAAAAAEILGLRSEQRLESRWSSNGPWRIGGQGLHFHYANGDGEFAVEASRLAGGGWRLSTSDGSFIGTIESAEPGTVLLRDATRVSRFDIAFAGRDIWVGHRGKTWRLTRPSAPSIESHGRVREAGGSRTITAPMPGRVARIEVEEGQRVAVHQVLVIMEAMKMEHSIEALAAGTVGHLYCAVGDLVSAGSMLVDLVESSSTPQR